MKPYIGGLTILYELQFAGRQVFYIFNKEYQFFVGTTALGRPKRIYTGKTDGRGRPSLRLHLFVRQGLNCNVENPSKIRLLLTK
jgi:hypothetical protein